MKKNRKIGNTKHIAIERTTCVSAILVSLVTVALFYYITDNRCVRLQQSIGREESRLDAIEKEWIRETDRWEDAKSDRNLKAALLRHGLRMDFPREDQIVRMDKHGKPLPGQLSLVKLERENAARQVALNGPAPRSTVAPPRVTTRTNGNSKRSVARR